MPSRPSSPAKSGILIVTLHEARDLSLPQSHQERYKAAFQPAGSSFGVAGSARGDGLVSSSYAHNGRSSSQAGEGINAAPTVHGRYNSRNLPYALLDFDKMQVFVDAVSGTPQNPYWAGDNTSYKFDVSRQTELTVNIFLRNPGAPAGAGRSQDIFLGVVKVDPKMQEAGRPAASHMNSEDRSRSSPSHPSDLQRTSNGTHWIDVAYGTGSMRIGIAFIENQHRALKIENFELLKVVGKGSFGKVMQVM